MTVAERFAANVIPEPNSGCWLWTASTTKFGYGHMSVDGRLTGAHRIAWVLFKGPIPAGAQVCHKCDVPQCANPDHLFLGSRSDNMRDCAAKGRQFVPREVNSHLTREQVLRVRALKGRLGRGEAKRLTEELGITDSALSRLRRGLRWAHL